MKKSLLTKSLMTLLLAGVVLPTAILAEEASQEADEPATEQTEESKEDNTEVEESDNEESSTSEDKEDKDESESDADSQDEDSKTDEESEEVADESESTEEKDSLLNLTGSLRQQLVGEAFEQFFDQFEDASVTEFQLTYNEAKDLYKFEFEGFDEENSYELDLEYQEDEWTTVKDETELLDEEDLQEAKDEAIDLDELVSLDTIEDHVKEDYPAGEFVKYELKLDQSRDQIVWEIELLDDKEELELKVDALTGEILSVDQDD